METREAELTRARSLENMWAYPNNGSRCFRDSGQIYLKYGMPLDALRAFRKGEHFDEMADVYESLGKYTQAARNIVRGVHPSWMRPESYRLYGQTFQEYYPYAQKKIREVLDKFNRAGNLYLKAGNIIKAIQCFQIAGNNEAQRLIEENRYSCRKGLRGITNNIAFWFNGWI